MTRLELRSWALGVALHIGAAIAAGLGVWVFDVALRRSR